MRTLTIDDRQRQWVVLEVRRELRTAEEADIDFLYRLIDYLSINGLMRGLITEE